MKHILKKRILPLLCAGLLLCAPHTTAYAAADGIEGTSPQAAESEPTEETPPPVETPPTAETTPPPVETPPTAETTPPPVETPPTAETTPPVETPPTAEIIPPVKPPAAENATATSYSVAITWESLEFDCAPLWNPDKHCYDDWKSTENPITVTNTTQSGAPVRVTMTFIPADKMGATAVFAPCEDDPHPEDFAFSDGKVTFLLPRDTDSEVQATVNLFLTGDPMGQEAQQYSQIGSIKTEITPLHEGTGDLVTVPPGVSDIQPPPASNLPLPKPEPPIADKPAEKPAQPAPTEPNKPETLPAQPSRPEPLPPQTAEGQPPEAVNPKQESTPDAMPPPEQHSQEEAQTAPHIKLGAPPQEEPQ